MGKLTVYVANVLADYTTTACQDMLNESGCFEAKNGVDITSIPGVPGRSRQYVYTDDIREFINKFSDHSVVLNLLLERADLDKQRWFSASNALLYMCYYLWLATDMKKAKTYCWDYLVIYFPEAYLDDFWIRILWNLFCNVVKKTHLNIYIYTHLDFYKIDNMNNEENMEVTVNLSTKLYIAESESNSNPIKNLINWVINKLKN